MPTSLYVALSAQTALMRRLESVASNVANADTPGYRADGVKFDSYVAASSSDPIAYATSGRDYITTTKGSVMRTGSALDVAVRGEAWFSVLTPNGPAYTRDGRLSLTPNGEITSVRGYPYLDAGGSALRVDPNGGPLSIGGDGSISQDGKSTGAIGMFEIDPAASLTRVDNSSVVPNIPAAPVGDSGRSSVMQGHLEQSNVDPVSEMSRLIQIQRAFETITASIDLTDQTGTDAVRTIGSPT